MEEIRRIKVGDVVLGHYVSDGAYRVTSVSPKGTVKGVRLSLRCTWTADKSMQNAYYRPTDEVADTTERRLGIIRQPTLPFDKQEHIWYNKEQMALFLDNGTKTLCTYMG